MRKYTGLFDKNGVEIKDGDRVSLGNVMTADDSFGYLPNGFHFNAEEDIYEVYWDDKISNWSLKLGVEPDTNYNIKYMNHALSIMHEGDSVIVNV